jgi:hypothetical protein
MSAEEFAEWFVYMSHEELLPEVERIRHAQSRATVLTAGGVTAPRGRGGWGLGDLMSLDAWPEPKAAVAELPLAEQIAQLNRRFR